MRGKRKRDGKTPKLVVLATVEVSAEESVFALDDFSKEALSGPVTAYGAELIRYEVSGKSTVQSVSYLTPYQCEGTEPFSEDKCGAKVGYDFGGHKLCKSHMLQLLDDENGPVTISTSDAGELKPLDLSGKLGEQLAAMGIKATEE